jgi:SagB-type dehydrogenase family enzyme
MQDALESPPYVLAFREGISVVEEGTGVMVRSASHTVPLRRTAPGIVAALRALAAGGVTEAAAAAKAEAEDGAATAPMLFFYLERFKQIGLLTYTACAGTRLATLVPDSAPVKPATPEPSARYVLSRFACLRRDDAYRLILESPLAHGFVRLHDPRAAALCQALAEPRSTAQLEERFPGAALPLLGLLLGCQAVTLDGPRGEAGDETLAVWTFYDLLFHARSRAGRHTAPLGGTFRFAGSMEPLPSTKPVMNGPRIALHRPDIEALKSHDVPFTRVLEERRSIRVHGERPIDVQQIGELFYRSARVRSLGMSTGAHVYPISSRPYPGGGACYELELYLVVRACDGLAPGLYHYEPEDHALTALSGATPGVSQLIDSARAAMVVAAEPQVVLVVAARFARVMWKYESMAYAIILKDVGALYQTVYLVATAMGLAPCALGAGDADLFAAVAGLDYTRETSVGEMALGSRAEA